MKRDAAIHTTEITSPIGTICLALHGEKVCALGFAHQWPALLSRLSGHGAWIPEPVGRPESLLRPVLRALNAYFAGDLDALSSVRVSLSGTPFQIGIWRQIRRIRPGTTVTYGEIARRAGAPGAARAVGQATGANPVSLIVPCHRIVGSGGRPGGYGGGLDRKLRLLAHEGVVLKP